MEHKWQEFMEGYRRCEHCGALEKAVRKPQYKHINVSEVVYYAEGIETTTPIECDPTRLSNDNPKDS